MKRRFLTSPSGGATAPYAFFPRTSVGPGQALRARVAKHVLLGALAVSSWTLGGCSLVRGYQAQTHIARGEMRLAENQMEAALAEFQAAAELEPQLAIAHSRMGYIYRRLGEFDTAIDCYVDAVRQDPRSFDDTFNLAQLYYFTQRIAESIRTYLRVVELQPGSFDAQLNLGVSYQQMADLDQAVERFRKAIEIDPNRSHAYVNLGVALAGQEKYYQAIRAYKEALERDSDQPLVLVNLAHTYLKQDRMKMAEMALDQAIRMQPQLAAAHESLGYCFFRTRDFDAATRSYMQALAYDWRLSRAHSGLGSINMLRFLEDDTLTDRRDRALEHWHRSLEINPDQARIRKLIARYHPTSVDPEQTLLVEHVGP